MNFDYQGILESIYHELQPFRGRGQLASYIPELAKVPIDRFGMSIYCCDGRTYSIGDAQQRFSLQSISKLFAFALAFSREGDAIWKRVGKEPSGSPFNSLAQLEYEEGIPRNPFINAGALVITDILATRFVQADIAVLQFCRMLSNQMELDFDLAVAMSEYHSAHRNRAIASFVKGFGNLVNPVDVVVENYCKQCAIAMNCEELAKAGSFLANGGVIGWNGQSVMDASSVKRINALMLTCGTYDAAGDFAYRVGLPAKSGVGGGILALIPGEASIAVWSPGLDATGNSLAGTYALERFTSMTARSIF